MSSSEQLGLVSNWNGLLKHWLPKNGGDREMKDWLTYLQGYVLILNMNMNVAKGVFLLNRFLFFWWIRARGVEEDAGILSSPYNLIFFSHDDIVNYNSCLKE